MTTISRSPTARKQRLAALDKESGGDKTQRIFLRTDKTVPHEDLMRTMDALRDAGHLKIALVAREKT